MVPVALRLFDHDDDLGILVTIYLIVLSTGHMPWRCAQEPMSTLCLWQNEMSVGGATVRLRLEVGRRDIP
jgi:hypothetical protein